MRRVHLRSWWTWEGGGRATSRMMTHPKLKLFEREVNYRKMNCTGSAGTSDQDQSPGTDARFSCSLLGLKNRLRSFFSFFMLNVALAFCRTEKQKLNFQKVIIPGEVSTSYYIEPSSSSSNISPTTKILTFGTCSQGQTGLENCCFHVPLNLYALSSIFPFSSLCGIEMQTQS